MIGLGLYDAGYLNGYDDGFLSGAITATACMVAITLTALIAWIAVKNIHTRRNANPAKPVLRIVSSKPN